MRRQCRIADADTDEEPNLRDSEKADLLGKVFSNALLHFEDRLP